MGRQHVRLAAAPAIHLALSGAFMVFYRKRFDLDPAVIQYHLLLLAMAWIAASETLLLAYRITPRAGRRILRVLCATAVCIAIVCQIVLYTLDWTFMTTMGNPVSFEMVYSFVTHFSGVIKLVPVPLQTLVPVVLVCVGVCALTGWWMARLLCRAVEALQTAPQPSVRLSGRFKRIVRRVLPAAALFAMGSSIAIASNDEISFWAGEPLFHLFFSSEPVSPESEAASLVASRVRDEYPKDVPFRKRNVIVIFVDDLRADHMSLYGYKRPTTPYLDSLMQAGHLRKVEMALASAPSTHRSVPGAMTSRAVAPCSYVHFTLADLLYDQGYSVRFIVSGPWSEYMGLEHALSHGLYSFIDGWDSSTYPLADDRVIIEKVADLPEHPESPSFIFLSFFSPHVLAQRLDEYQRFMPSMNVQTIRAGQSNFMENIGGQLAPTDLDAYINFYDNGIVQTDAMIQRVLGMLDDKGYLEDSLVCIFSDHGEGLGEHQHFGHCGPLYIEDLHVPLLFYETDPPAYGNLEFASLVDLFPTIVGRLGLPIPSSCEGQSLLLPGGDRLLLHHSDRAGRVWTWAATYRTEGRTFSYIRTSEAGQFVDEAYDLGSDPTQTQNILTTGDRTVLDHMKSSVDEWSQRLVQIE